MKSSFWTRAASWIVTILVPVIFTLLSIRLLINPYYLRFEYNMPGFPADPYGFTTQDRIRWAQFAMDYLVNDAGIEYIGDLRFEDGMPLYNDGELSHMVDVKNTVQAAFTVLYGSIALLASICLWAWFGKWWKRFLVSLRRGGWLSVILIGGLVFFSIMAFGVFFTAFHNVFFQPGTWQFLWSDTLIRLFPTRFWQDIFIYVGILVVLGGLALGLGLRKVSDD
jgi:integral membrane protein (TIGR01906 family)